MVFFDGRDLFFLLGITFESVTVCPEKGRNMQEYLVVSFSHDGERGRTEAESLDA
jgi:hypothetical protein